MKGAGLALAVHWTVGGRRLLTAAECRRLATAALARGGRAGGALSLVFVGDEELARLHAEHLDDPRPTDVMAFELGTAAGAVEGEVYVSVERARAVARRRGLLPRREVALYLVHGCLHLAGFDDLEPRARRRMRAAERAVLAPLGFAHAARRTRRRTTRAFPARVTRAATTPSAARRARTKSGISRGKGRTRARG